MKASEEQLKAWSWKLGLIAASYYDEELLAIAEQMSDTSAAPEPSPWITSRPPTVEEVGDVEICYVLWEFDQNFRQGHRVTGAATRREWGKRAHAWLPGSNKPPEKEEAA